MPIRPKSLRTAQQNSHHSSENITTAWSAMTWATYASASASTGATGSGRGATTGIAATAGCGAGASKR